MVGFKIAGGIIILSTSVTTLIHGNVGRQAGGGGRSAVGPPLIVGPGTMTALILYSIIYGPKATLIASLTASALSVATLYLGARLVKLFGPVPAKALGRLLRTRSGKIMRRVLKRV